MKIIIIIIYKDENNRELSFEDLLQKDGALSIHDRNLQKLAILMYRVKNDLAPKPIQELFLDQVNTYDLRHMRTWQVPSVKTVTYGTETIRYRGPKTWDLLPENIKNANTLGEFKRKVKTWKPNGCTCRLCLTYAFHYGFL